MSKCINCGKSFIISKKIKLADADICSKCFKNLGFDTSYANYTAASYKWDDIKNGYEEYKRKRDQEYWNAEYLKQAEQLNINIKHYKQLKEIGATTPEKKIFSAINAVLLDEDCETNVIDIALGHNGSVLLMVNGVVFLEYKSDNGVKWIRFTNESEDKIKISGPAKINAIGSRVVNAFRSAI